MHYAGQCLVGLCMAPSVGLCLAQASPGVALVESGLNAYVKDGATAALSAWLKGSALEGNPQATTQSNALKQIEDFYGKPESFQILGDSAISERSRMITFTVNHQKGLVFGRMQVYRLPSGQWVSTEFKFHSDASQIFPPAMIFGKGEV